ncbi:PREDICTED: uncharacterized protein C14orf142 homolog [Chrysochloris asiatica]|uniref:Uncharacterized protein C14orf142 homolog n=1 Tax=Chrysochloris asiatica TaxID=185453 RepID=A0A9B0TRY2_CHRAS|nr:PREDICTED: uncharacterized protein C14orf142 homolog [Chrysochloris asiatica]
MWLQGYYEITSSGIPFPLKKELEMAGDLQRELPKEPHHQTKTKENKNTTPNKQEVKTKERYKPSDELLAEFVRRDGQRHHLRVSCEAPNHADPPQGLLSGVAQLRERLAELFSSLVQQEAQDPVAVAAGGEALNGDAEDDTEDENNPDNRINSDGPSAKRPKPPT